MNPDLPLRDIHLPPEVGFWPPAWGWWVLALLLLLGLWWLLRWRQQRTPVRRLTVVQPALQELARIEQNYQHDPEALVKAVSVLLRRSAISLYGRQRISGLTGSKWLAFLDAHSKQPVFSQRFAAALTESPYRPQPDSSAQDLLAAVRQWLKEQETRQQTTPVQEGRLHV